MTNRWDETWHRLREWTNGSANSERLTAQILLDDGYKSIDPSHPLGGKDGGKDAVGQKGSERWIMAVYFPRGQKEFSEIKAKFIADFAGVSKNSSQGLAFVTNQELRLSEREELQSLKENSIGVELFHLERITTILDKPAMAEVRKQFLDIEFSGQSVVSELKDEMYQIQRRLEGLQTSGDS
ncbi:hypothetical protein [Gimesia aquarii]|uniref:Restriction endonuclease type IV Mrr domain-containing protein n=1 Tax=Gimesia aquarii TaxID=2527964 RepID=A0A517WSC8_9PLAN|nr:hypothetical protein [Gimesia aquarii]QDU08159.1 hypothetical protein V202x_15230 [Gimesia aquarii]